MSYRHFTAADVESDPSLAAAVVKLTTAMHAAKRIDHELVVRVEDLREQVSALEFSVYDDD